MNQRNQKKLKDVFILAADEVYARVYFLSNVTTRTDQQSNH